MVGQNGTHVKRTYERTCAQVDARVSTQVDAQVSQYCASRCERGRIHMCIFTCSFLRSTIGPKSTLFMNMLTNKVDCGPKVDLKNEQVKMHMWMRPLYTLNYGGRFWTHRVYSGTWYILLTCALICASTCASTCALRISYLRATPGVFLKSLFTTFWNQLIYTVLCRCKYFCLHREHTYIMQQTYLYIDNWYL